MEKTIFVFLGILIFLIIFFIRILFKEKKKRNIKNEKKNDPDPPVKNTPAGNAKKPISKKIDWVNLGIKTTQWVLLILLAGLVLRFTLIKVNNEWTKFRVKGNLGYIFNPPTPEVRYVIDTILLQDPENSKTINYGPDLGEEVSFTRTIGGNLKVANATSDYIIVNNQGKAFHGKKGEDTNFTCGKGNTFNLRFKSENGEMGSLEIIGTKIETRRRRVN